MKPWAWLAIALQLGALVWIAGEREWIRRYSPTVYLRTAPVDPRDPFRGDFVRLEYDIGALSAAQLQVLQPVMQLPRAVVYAPLRIDERGVAELVGVGTGRPAEGLFIRGRVGTAVNRDWQQRSDVLYGIEKYFVPQGAGLVIEEQRGMRNDWQTPMEVEVALSAGGTPVIKGYRWSPLSIRLEIVEPGVAPLRDDVEPPRRRSPKLRISLRNQGDTAWTLLKDEAHCVWQLLDNSAPGWQPAPLARDCSGWEQHAQPLALAPGSSESWEFDLAESQWWLERDGGRVEIGDPDHGWKLYRFVYMPPPTQDLPQPVDAAPIWRSALRTAQFNAGGRVD